MIMNIDTDLVKEKWFDSAIKPNLLKYSNEYKALAVLRYFYPEKYNTMIHSEAPDLQDTTNGVGIEVTIAVRENDMKVLRLLSELRNGNPNRYKKNKEKIESSNHKLSSNKNIYRATATATDYGDKIIFQNSIRKKTKNLHKYKKNFNKIGLALLFLDNAMRYTEDDFKTWIVEVTEETKDSFDFFYVIYSYFCMYYNNQDNKLEKRSITKKEKQLLFKIARMTAEGELSLDDLEWQ